MPCHTEISFSHERQTCLLFSSLSYSVKSRAAWPLGASLPAEEVNPSEPAPGGCRAGGCGHWARNEVRYKRGSASPVPGLSPPHHGVTAFPLVLPMGVSATAWAPPRDSNGVNIMILYYIYVCLSVCLSSVYPSTYLSTFLYR